MKSWWTSLVIRNLQIKTNSEIQIILEPSGALLLKTKQETLLKVLWNHIKFLVTKVVMNENTKAGGITRADFKMLQLTQPRVGCMRTHRPVEQNRDWKWSPCICSQLIFDRGAKNIHWEEHILSSKWCCENWVSTCRRMKYGTNPTPPPTVYKISALKT